MDCQNTIEGYGSRYSESTCMRHRFDQLPSCATVRSIALYMQCSLLDCLFPLCFSSWMENQIPKKNLYKDEGRSRGCDSPSRFIFAVASWCSLASLPSSPAACPRSQLHHLKLISKHAYVLVRFRQAHQVGCKSLGHFDPGTALS